MADVKVVKAYDLIRFDVDFEDYTGNIIIDVGSVHIVLAPNEAFLLGQDIVEKAKKAREFQAGLEWAKKP